MPLVLLSLLASFACSRLPETDRFMLPAIEVDSSVVVGPNAYAAANEHGMGPQMRSTVDGVDTIIPWRTRNYPPRAFRLDAKHDLIFAPSNEQLFLWTRATKTAVALGRGKLEEVPGLGQIIRAHTEDWSVNFCEVDLVNQKLRTLYLSGGEVSSGAGVIGRSGSHIFITCGRTWKCLRSSNSLLGRNQG